MSTNHCLPLIRINKLFASNSSLWKTPLGSTKGTKGQDTLFSTCTSRALLENTFYVAMWALMLKQLTVTKNYVFHNSGSRFQSFHKIHSTYFLLNVRQWSQWTFLHQLHEVFTKFPHLIPLLQFTILWKFEMSGHLLKTSVGEEIHRLTLRNKRRSMLGTLYFHQKTGRDFLISS